MSNKPIRFCIKFWLDSDVKSKYIVNGFPYLEKHERRESSVRLRREVILKAEFYTGCGRNITTDNFFYNCVISKEKYASWNYSEKQKGVTKSGETDKGQYESFLNNLIRTK